MNKISLYTIYNKYSGLIIPLKNGRFYVQNSNDLGILSGLEEAKEEIINVDKIIKVDNVKIVLSKMEDFDNVCNSFRTLEEAINDIKECYNFK